MTLVSDRLPSLLEANRIQTERLFAPGKTTASVPEADAAHDLTFGRVGEDMDEQLKRTYIASQMKSSFAQALNLTPALASKIGVLQDIVGGNQDGKSPAQQSMLHNKTQLLIQDSITPQRALPAVNGNQSLKLLQAAPSSTATGAIATKASSTGQSNAYGGPSQQLVHRQSAAPLMSGHTTLSSALLAKKEARSHKPDYHPNWTTMRVISGHLGWVRSIAVDPTNQWFATGASDRVIKIWDLASGQLRLSLTGHISAVRGLAVSDRHPYLFSAGEDKTVKCWDLEQNRVIRSYHGHLSGVYALSLHPTLDVLVSAGRDAVARVWDMRTKTQIHVLSGHTGTVASVQCQDSDPQVITGSMDSTIRLWDLAAGKTMATLTHHKKSVRALAIHPTEFSFASGSAGNDSIKKWALPAGTFVHNFSRDAAIVNTLSINADGVLFSGADNGTYTFWDYKSGRPFQSDVDKPQPGSLDAEKGVFCSTFDKTGSRLITGCADKTIKIFKEVA